jgi:hypothetical protein
MIHPRLTDNIVRVACPRAHHHPSHVRGLDADPSLSPIRLVLGLPLRPIYTMATFTITHRTALR